MPLNNNSNKQFVEREPIDIDAIVVSSSSAPLSLQEIDARICAVNAAINAAHGTVVGGNSAAITKLTAALATLQTLKIQTEVAVAETQELALKEQQAAEATAAAAKIVLMDYKNNICY